MFINISSALLTFTIVLVFIAGSVFVFMWKQKDRDVNLLGPSERATVTVSSYPTFYQKIETDPGFEKF